MDDLTGHIEQQTALLLDTARRLPDATAPSLCTGWSRGHVLTHVARNADGLSALVRSAVDGTGETMYRSGEGRDADIEAGAARPVGELVADIAATAASLATELPRLQGVPADARVERTPGGVTFRVVHLPFMRLREVVYHHVDLDAGFGFADLEPGLLDLLLTDEVRRSEHSHDAKAATLLWLARGIRKDPVA